MLGKAIIVKEKLVKFEYMLKIGDTVEYAIHGEWRNSIGKVTCIFNGGHQCILDDEKTLFTSDIISINGVDLKNKGDSIKCYAEDESEVEEESEDVVSEK